MSQLGVILQESLGTERERRTILGLLTEQMEAVDDREPRRRRSLKERLRFTGMGCCGATWGSRPTTVRHGGEIENDDDEDERRQQQRRLRTVNPGQGSSSSDPDCVAPISAGSGMNLAAALAAERQFRGTQEAEARSEGSGGGGRSTTVSAAPETPWRVSLMRLLEETEGGGDCEVTAKATETEKGGVGNDTVCCVCMGRKKGAAFIPCGHTFCRVCSRELWLNRGTCPLCNRSILEILDIF